MADTSGTKSSRPARALDGITVVEVSTFVAGPFCGSLLAEQGADVIKIELPKTGDPFRRVGHLSSLGVSFAFLSEQRNKKSVTLDLRKPKGAALFLALVEQADVVIENFQVGTLEKWGVGWDAIQRRNPRAILARISGFGQDGPYRHRASIGRIANGFGGISFLTGEPDRSPANPGSPMLADYTSGINAALGIMFALRAREATGRGQVVDIGMYETIFRLTDEMAAVYEQTGKVRMRHGAAAPHAIPHNHYRTKDDRWIGVACTSDKLWTRFAQAMDRADLARDPGYATYATRLDRRETLEQIVSEWVARHTRDEVLAACVKADVPCGPIFGIDEIFEDPQYAARGTLARVDDDRLGPVTVPNVVIRLSDTPGHVDTLGPNLGAHNEEILCGRLGLSPAELRELSDREVI
ncbi:MAG: CaiB/BaiF CoA transferase family protein [Pseudorhodoplanes sp.]|uniref:CaiB/BaiF CoA transferase family protein n=1 Tax=Pseudorhodoplanes sp. TaxID=1934341 RepID=UPI003D0D82CE